MYVQRIVKEGTKNMVSVFKNQILLYLERRKQFLASCFLNFLPFPCLWILFLNYYMLNWLVDWSDNPYLWEDASTTHSSYFIGVVQERKISFCGPIEFKYFNWAKPHQKFLPYRRSDTISKSKAHFMNSVVFFLWIDKKKHPVAEKSGSKYLKLI